MIINGERRRVLLAASSAAQEQLTPLFQNPSLNHWHMQTAESYTQARFALQYEPSDVLMVHQDLMEREGGQGLSWLASNIDRPVVFLSKGGEMAARAYTLGASLCVPAEDIVQHPPLLSSVLQRATELKGLRANLTLTRERLTHSRRHADRLINLLWRSTPHVQDGTWFSHRYMLERLQEELARTERHKVPLTLILGEVEQKDGEGLPRWAMEAIVRAKRRCDVAGQYGMHGFLLLLVQTAPEGGKECVRRLQQVIEHPPEALAGPIAPRAYFGVAGATEDRSSAVALLRAAEESLEESRKLAIA